MFSFRIEAQDGRARAGCLQTAHGTVETPAFLPVATHGAVKGISWPLLRETGAAMVLMNAFHLSLRPGEELVAAGGGLHRFTGWEGPILTDSGGYQVFSLAGLRRVSDEGVLFRSPVDGSERFFTPESVVDLQRRLGADIIMQLDECPPGKAGREEVERATARSLAWARRSLAHFAQTPGEGQTLLPIVQGGAFGELRRRAATELAELNPAGFGLGGFAVGEDKVAGREALAATLEALPAEKPRYLMGVGAPGNVLEAIALGVDLFDCVLPTRNGRNGQALTGRGPLRLRNAACQRSAEPLDPACDCFVCRRFSRAYLRHLFLAGEMLAGIYCSAHNLAFLFRVVREARAAIHEGTFGAYRQAVLARLSEREEGNRP